MDARQDRPDRRRVLKVVTIGGIATTLLLPTKWQAAKAQVVECPDHAQASAPSKDHMIKCASPPPAPFSDVRLKEDITPLMQLDNGIGLYRYRYKWDHQLFVGVMAQEVADIVPTAVLRGQDGYLRVDYGQLGMRLMTWDEWVAREGDKPWLMQ